jgi:hypothetical protein
VKALARFELETDGLPTKSFVGAFGTIHGPSFASSPENGPGFRQGTALLQRILTTF